MPKRYGREFRRSICERLVAGESVTAVCEQVGCVGGDAASVEAPGPDRCRPASRAPRASRSTNSLRPSAPSKSSKPNSRSVKAASALFNGEEPVSPKRRCQVAQGLSNLGYTERVACRIAGVSRSCLLRVQVPRAE